MLVCKWGPERSSIRTRPKPWRLTHTLRISARIRRGSTCGISLTMKVAHLAVVSVGLLSLAAGCGDDGGGGGGGFATLRGQVTSGPSLRVTGGFSLVDTSKADAIWAIPAGEPRQALGQKIVVELEADGSFAFTPDQQGVDYILALVDTAACTNPTPRKDWTETQIDARTSCILGYVSIPDAESTGSLIVIPTSDMTDDADVGELAPSTTISDEANSSKTLQDIASSFDSGLDSLLDLARVDNTLKALVWTYANMSDDGSKYYSLSPNYSFLAPNSLERAAVTPTNATEFIPLNWSPFFQTTVDSSVVNFEFIAPHRLDNSIGTVHYKKDEAIDLSAISTPFKGAAEGVWKVRRAGEVVAKFDMQISSPFGTTDGLLDASKVTAYVPTLELQTAAGGALTAVTVRLKTWDGTSYVDANAELAFARFGVMGVTLFGDGSAGCVGNDEFSTLWDTVAPDALTYIPKNPWITGLGDASSCGITSAGVNYRMFGSEYSFTWRRSIDPFTVSKRSASYLALAPDNGVGGTYVDFRITPDILAEELRDLDIWVELTDIVTTPTAGLVKLGTGEDGVFHLRNQTTNSVSFYLEYAGAGAPPTSYETSATLTVHDGRPGVSRRSDDYSVSWSNIAPLPNSTLSIASYEELPTGIVHLGGQHEFKVFGSINGAAQGDHISFSPASVLGWPADEYELVSSRVLLLEGGTLNTAELCFDAGCTSTSSTAADGLAFYIAAAGDFDFQAYYTLRWAGSGSTPTLSSMVFNLGAALFHALASDNSAAPALESTTSSAQMTMAVSPTIVSIAGGPLRVEYSATVNHSASNGFFGDTISVDLPAGARVIARTSVWQVGEVEESVPEPTRNGTSHEWPFQTFIPAGSDATLRFEVLLEPTTGTQLATGQAWVGHPAVDLTAGFDNDAPANASVTVNP